MWHNSRLCDLCGIVHPPCHIGSMIQEKQWSEGRVLGRLRSQVLLLIHLGFPCVATVTWTSVWKAFIDCMIKLNPFSVISFLEFGNVSNPHGCSLTTAMDMPSTPTQVYIPESYRKFWRQIPAMIFSPLPSTRFDRWFSSHRNCSPRTFARLPAWGGCPGWGRPNPPARRSTSQSPGVRHQLERSIASKATDFGPLFQPGTSPHIQICLLCHAPASSSKCWPWSAMHWVASLVKNLSGSFIQCKLWFICCDIFGLDWKKIVRQTTVLSDMLWYIDIHRVV